MSPERSGGRGPDDLRPTTIEANFVRPATGSALISCGETRVICTASVQESVPRWMTGQGRGWLTAEYGMLPEPAAVIEPEPQPEPEPEPEPEPNPEPVAAVEEPKRGFWARLFGRKQPAPVAPEPEPEPVLEEPEPVL